MLLLHENMSISLWFIRHCFKKVLVLLLDKWRECRQGNTRTLCSSDAKFWQQTGAESGLIRKSAWCISRFKLATGDDCWSVLHTKHTVTWSRRVLVVFSVTYWLFLHFRRSNSFSPVPFYAYVIFLMFLKWQTSFHWSIYNIVYLCC